MENELGISEVSEIIGVSKHTIRFYEKEGLITTRNRTEGGYRLYDMETIWTLRTIVLLRKCGISIAEIKELLYNYSDEKYKEIIEESYKSVCDEIEQLNKIKTRLSLVNYARKTFDDGKLHVITKPELLLMPVMELTFDIYNSPKALYNVYKNIAKDKKVKVDEKLYFTIINNKIWIANVSDYKDENCILFEKSKYLVHTFKGDIDLEAVEVSLKEMEKYSKENNFLLDEQPIIELLSIESLALSDMNNDIITISKKIK